MLSLERQKAESSCLLLVGCYHIRIYKVYLVKIASLEFLDDHFSYLACPVESRILCGVEEFSVYERFLAAVHAALEIHSSHLSDNEKVAVVKVSGFFKLLFGILYDIVVIASAEPLISRNDDISLFTLFVGDIRTPVEELLTGMGSMLKHTVDSGLELVEVRLSCLKGLSCLLQL